MRSRRLPVALGVGALLLAGGIAVAVAVWPEGGMRVATDDGRFAFSAPRDWQRSGCPNRRSSCVQVHPPSAGGQDYIFVDTFEGGGLEDLLLLGSALPGLAELGGQQVTVDHLPAVRAEVRDQHAILVSGVMPGGGTARFAVMCQYDRQEQAIRSGCDQVVDTLKIRR